ncbi:unnamed protein product [Withania somnifera]
MVSERNMSKNVCIIGAGPSGLVAARELRKEGHNLVVLEQNHDVGGQWLYQPKVEHEDPLGRTNVRNVYSSIYASLRLTSPREIMGYTDFPFVVKKGRDPRRFPGHRELLLYLQDFCEYFGLREIIRFNTRVEYVGMLNYPEFGKDLRWIVKSKENDSEKGMEEIFDAIVVATGHYTQPRLPNINGMDAWRRKQMHSHIYRVPEPFRNEVVVVVGNSLSGQDIGMELVDVAKEIHLSAKSLDVSEGLSKVISKHHNLHLRPQLIGFPFFESQAKWIALLLSGKRTLPSWGEMMQSIKEFYCSREVAGIPKHNTHDLANFEYCDKYADYIGFPHLEEWRKELCLSALRNADINLDTYRDSYDDTEMLQAAYQSPHFAHLGPEAF